MLRPPSDEQDHHSILAPFENALADGGFVRVCQAEELHAQFLIELIDCARIQRTPDINLPDRSGIRHRKRPSAPSPSPTP